MQRKIKNTYFERKQKANIEQKIKLCFSHAYIGWC